MHLRRRVDLVQVNTVPDVLVFAALLPRLTGARVLLDLQEPLPEFLATKAGIGERHPAVRLAAALEQASIRFADAALTVTEQMRQAFVARGASPDKITVVMDGSDENVFDPTRFPRGRPEDDKFLVVSHGTIEPQYGLDTAIRAVAQLAPGIPSIELRILGDGSQRTELQSLACSLGVSDRVEFSPGFVPSDELVATLATSDVGLVALKRDRFRDLTLAGKMFDFIAMGIPMVVSATRSVDETFPSGCFESFTSDDPSDLARAIERLYRDPKLAMTYAARAKDVAQPYSWAVQRQHYWEVVDALLNLEIPSGTEGLDITLTRRPESSTLTTWDELVRNTPGSDVSQLSAWAEVRRTAGFEPLYVFVRRATELVGGALILTRRLPLIGEVGYVSYGPMIAPDVGREPVIDVLVAALRRLADRRMRMLFVQPPPGADDIALELRRNGFRPSQAGIAPAASLRLDLAKGEDELYAGLKRDFQKKYRRWARHAVQVRRGTQDDVPLLARLHAASAQHHGFTPIPHDYIANLYRQLAPLGHAELFVGEVEGRQLCASLLTGCGGVLKGRLTGMDRDPKVSRLGIPAAVVWEAIRWAKANGYRWFDFGGIRETAASILEEQDPDLARLTGPESFKIGFGPTPFRYPMPVEMISSPLIRGAYDLSIRWPAGRRLVERTSHSLRAGPRLRRRDSQAK
jgi:glycosyltransferase involved in cell wall biosynthesis/lipid II:glycine glycyltransferase (peptidoglycan interpeptide bridge formation enzyme)